MKDLLQSMLSCLRAYGLCGLLASATSASFACQGDPKPEDFGPPVTIAPEDLIDDFEDGDDSLKSVGGRQGYWYTYKDPTPGMLTPDESAPVMPMEPGPGGMGKALKVFGGGFKQWGAGVGFQFNKNMNEMPMPYNVSAFTGVAFMGKGNVPIRVGFGVPDVLPSSEGGTCVNNAAMDNCNDLHSMVVRLSSEWRQYKIPFNRLAQQGYGMTGTWDPTKVISAIFHVDVVPNFEMIIDDVGFYK